MKIRCITAVILVSIFTAGCAGIEPPMPQDILNNPLGTSSVRIGMTKNQIKDIWGEPDEINFVEDEKQWKGPREEWVYKAKARAVPIDVGYLSKTQRLYFDGENLTTIKGEK